MRNLLLALLFLPLCGCPSEPAADADISSADVDAANDSASTDADEALDALNDAASAFDAALDVAEDVLDAALEAEAGDAANQG